MTNKEILKANKKNYPFRPNEKVVHVLRELQGEVKEINWVSVGANRGEQGITFKDNPSVEVHAYFYKFAE